MNGRTFQTARLDDAGGKRREREGGEGVLWWYPSGGSFVWSHWKSLINSSSYCVYAPFVLGQVNPNLGPVCGRGILSE